MRCRLKLDNRFWKYIKNKKDITGIAVVLALGLLLIFLGGKSTTSNNESDPGMEERIATACSDVEGVGACSVFVYYSPTNTKEKEDNVESIIVICEGADSLEVRMRLTKMLSSFFGIGSNRVRIEKMKE